MTKLRTLWESYKAGAGLDAAQLLYLYLPFPSVSAPLAPHGSPSSPLVKGSEASPAQAKQGPQPSGAARKEKGKEKAKEKGKGKGKEKERGQSEARPAGYAHLTVSVPRESKTSPPLSLRSLFTPSKRGKHRTAGQGGSLAKKVCRVWASEGRVSYVVCVGVLSSSASPEHDKV